MKHLFQTILLIGLTIFVTSSNYAIENPKTGEPSKTETSKQYEWGPWQTASCYGYLKYQIKKAEYEGKWFIRFKNNYSESISMSIEVEGNTGTKTDSGRFTVRSGDTQSQYYYVDKNASRISFSIDKVKFNDSSWGGPYADCDH